MGSRDDERAPDDLLRWTQRGGGRLRSETASESRAREWTEPSSSGTPTAERLSLTLDEPRQDGINHIADVRFTPDGETLVATPSTTPRACDREALGPDPSADTPREDSVQSNASGRHCVANRPGRGPGFARHDAAKSCTALPGSKLRRRIRKHLSQTCRGGLAAGTGS